jgi:ribonuclease HI
MSRMATKAVTTRGKQEAKPVRAVRSQDRRSEPKANDPVRRRWDAMVDSHLWVEARKVALDRGLSPNDALEEALRDYVTRHTAK